jgi:hypothetical protein
MEEPEVKLGGGKLLERNESIAGTGRFPELLGGHSFWSVVEAFSSPLGRYLLRHCVVFK